MLLTPHHKCDIDSCECIHTFSPLCQLACPPARVQRPLLHAGNPGGPEPAGGGGEEGAEVQLQEEEGEAGETLQHQGGVARQVHPGDRGQAGDSEPGVGPALCVVSTAVTSEGRTLARHDSRFHTEKLAFWPAQHFVIRIKVFIGQTDR